MGQVDTIDSLSLSLAGEVSERVRCECARSKTICKYTTVPG